MNQNIWKRDLLNMAFDYEYALDDYQNDNLLHLQTLNLQIPLDLELNTFEYVEEKYNFDSERQPWLRNLSRLDMLALFEKTFFIDRAWDADVHYVYYRFYPFYTLLLMFMILTRNDLENEDPEFNTIEDKIFKSVYTIHPWSRPFFEGSIFMSDEPENDSLFSEEFYILLCEKMYWYLQKVRNTLISKLVPEEDIHRETVQNLFNIIDEFGVSLMNYVRRQI